MGARIEIVRACGQDVAGVTVSFVAGCVIGGLPALRGAAGRRLDQACDLFEQTVGNLLGDHAPDVTDVGVRKMRPCGGPRSRQIQPALRLRLRLRLPARAGRNQRATPTVDVPRQRRPGFRRTGIGDHVFPRGCVRAGSAARSSAQKKQQKKTTSNVKVDPKNNSDPATRVCNCGACCRWWVQVARRLTTENLWDPARH